jgi:hypothetical protein
MPQLVTAKDTDVCQQREIERLGANTIFLATLLPVSLGRQRRISLTSYPESPIRQDLKTVTSRGGTSTYYQATSPLQVAANSCITTSTTFLNPSISSSTVPPIPAPAKLIEFPTYTGRFVLRASSLARRVVNSTDDS